MSDADEKASSRVKSGAKGGKDEKDDMELHMQDIGADEKGVPPKRTSGWGDGPGAAGDASKATDTKGEEATEAAETKRGRRRKEEKAEPTKPKNKHFDDDGEATGWPLRESQTYEPMDVELMEIPDLEEEEREPDITMQIADAPRNTTRVVQSLKELERDVKYSLPPTTGVDLQILTSFLAPQKAVLEDDDSWDFDSLLRDVFQDIQKDIDEKDNQEEAEQSNNAAAPVKAP
ncbi:Aste57867_3373 [Aphanomyces stellatus]|uniref:Aste57867_3373 protein n=1 Tax=Aphanomyces stellatus TaxID=120398 RepID=A0A485KBY6_9STRA|nr:hypothetical protein As57867_003363 [Aphanomyces stellatus]VFT80539.1 Aste57867_3373 [Aphanomyces stellatus]